ncbi:MAG TPA: rRNA maturation RNAse YbeY [Candidatus Azoamicus sp.]
MEINIIIMSKISIKNINKKYRKKNNETDILTFKTN